MNRSTLAGLRRCPSANSTTSKNTIPTMTAADNKLLSRRDYHSNSSSPLILRKATSADVDALAEVYLSSFAKNPWSNLVFPYTKASYDWWRFSLSKEIKNPNSHFLCVYDSSIPWQPIVSWAQWDDPNALVQVC